MQVQWSKNRAWFSVNFLAQGEGSVHVVTQGEQCKYRDARGIYPRSVSIERFKPTSTSSLILDGDACHSNESCCPPQSLRVTKELVPQRGVLWPCFSPNNIMKWAVLEQALACHCVLSQG